MKGLRHRAVTDSRGAQLDDLAGGRVDIRRLKVESNVVAQHVSEVAAVNQLKRLEQLRRRGLIVAAVSAQNDVVRIRLFGLFGAGD